MSKGRRIFIDCGGHDGCSVIKFLKRRPGFRAVTFEPNPAFERYYSYLPTSLIMKAVNTFDGHVWLTVDPIDGDGSSIVEGKAVEYYGTLTNDQCPRIQVPCVDLSSFVARTVTEKDYLCLKLDVEGAEYPILHKMIDDQTIHLVRELMVEFHWEKCGVPEAEHVDLLRRLKARTAVSEWDAGPYAIHKRGPRAVLKRTLQLSWIWPEHLAKSLFGGSIGDRTSLSGPMPG